MDKGADLIAYSIIGSLVSSLNNDFKGTLKAINAGRLKSKEEGLFKASVKDKALAEILTFQKLAEFVQSDDNTLHYKARPLNGIWATSPYLHNGSVRTMRQLLLPPEKREKIFKVGSRQYDPKEMGFVNEGGFQFDTQLTGKSNLGNDYGAAELEANPKKLDALIEYLKTL